MLGKVWSQAELTGKNTPQIPEGTLSLRTPEPMAVSSKPVWAEELQKPVLSQQI